MNNGRFFRLHLIHGTAITNEKGVGMIPIVNSYEEAIIISILWVTGTHCTEISCWTTKITFGNQIFIYCTINFFPILYNMSIWRYKFWFGSLRLGYIAHLTLKSFINFAQKDKHLECWAFIYCISFLTFLSWTGILWKMVR